MASILILSNNPELIAPWTHALINQHSVNRLLNAHKEHQADVVIVEAKKLDEDVSLFGMLNNRQARYLVIGSCWPENKQIEVFARGAAGYCEEAEASVVLLRAVDSILKGDVWIKRALVPKVIDVLSGKYACHGGKHSSPVDKDRLVRMVESLSARELEVAEMIRQGENNRTIATALEISERTVKAHLSSIFRKFEVDDRLRLAIRLKELESFR